MRTGNPCSRGSASPFIPTASSAPRSGSSTTAVGVPAVQPSTLVESSWSAASCTPASRRRSRRETPTKVALDTSGPPTSLDTQVNVRVRATRGRASRSANESVSSRSTMPWTRSVQSAAESAGTRSAASIR